MSKPRTLERASDRHRLVTEDFTIREAAADDASGGLGTITATLARGNHINRNRRYYSATVLEKAANAARDRVEAGKVIGLMDHPNFWDGDGDRGKPERTVIRWNRLWMDGPDLKGEGVIVGTALGHDLLAMKQAKVHLGLSTNAYVMAHFENAEDVPAPWDGDAHDLIQVVDEITELLTIDVVNDPSNVYAQIEQEAREARQAFEEASMKQAGNPQTEPAPAPDNAAGDEVAKLREELAAARAELEATKADAAKAERAALVTEALAGQTVPDVVRKAMTDAAQAAETVDAAREAVKALADAFNQGGGHGNNHIPDDGQPVADALAEARQQIGVTA